MLFSRRRRIVASGAAVAASAVVVLAVALRSQSQPSRAPVIEDERTLEGQGKPVSVGDKQRRMIPAPQLVGLSLARAEQVADQVGLYLDYESSFEDAFFPDGVCKQRPAAGTPIAAAAAGSFIYVEGCGDVAEEEELPSATRTKPTPPRALEVSLDDWHDGDRVIGVALLTPIDERRVRVTLDVDVTRDLYPLRVTIYGGKTPGIGGATDCGVVYNNSLDVEAGTRADDGIAVAFPVGEFASLDDARIVEASLAEISTAGEAVGVWIADDWLGGCGDI